MNWQLVAQSMLVRGRDSVRALRARRSGYPIEGPLPAVLLAGAQRCGTTSLAAWLDSHHIAHIGANKEVHFFDRHHARGLQWYRSQFNKTPSLDSTPAYLHVPEAAERMAQVLPTSTRIVVVLRDPVERAMSHYSYQRRRRVEWRSFEQALDDERRCPDVPAKLRAPIRRHFRYIANGCYGSQLQRLHAVLPDNLIHVSDFHRLFADDDTELRTLKKFLGVENRETDPLPHLNHAMRLDVAMPGWARDVLEADNEKLPALTQRTLSWMG